MPRKLPTVRQKSGRNGVIPSATRLPLQSCGIRSGKLPAAQPRDAHITTLSLRQTGWYRSLQEQVAIVWQLNWGQTSNQTGLLLVETKQPSLITQMPSSLREARKTYKCSSGSVPGSDEISFPIISQLGLADELAFLQTINKFWQMFTLPQSRNRADIISIP